jgi:hypothetical protein
MLISTAAAKKPGSSSLIWVSSANKLATYDVVTKEFTLIGDTGITNYDIAMSPDGILYGVDSSGNELYTIDRQTAKASHIVTLSPQGFVNSLTFAQQGALYGCQGTNLVKIHTETGVVTILGDIGVGSAGDMVFFNNNLYMSASNNTLILVNIGDPAHSAVIGEIPLTYGLATVYISEGFNGNYHLYGTAGDSQKIYEINPHNAKISNTATLPTFGDGYATNGATSSQFTLL